MSSRSPSFTPPRLSRVCVPGREQPDRDLAERRAGGRRRDGGRGRRGAVAGARDPRAPACSRRQTPLITERAWVAARLVVGLLCLALTTVTLVCGHRGRDRREHRAGGRARLSAAAAVRRARELFERASKLLDGMGSALAVTELQTPQTRVRSLAIAATAAVAVFGIVEFQGTQTNLEAGLDASCARLDSSADIWVTPSGQVEPSPTTSVQGDRHHRARACCPASDGSACIAAASSTGASAAYGYSRQPADIEHRSRSASSSAATRVSPQQRLREGGWAVLSQALAAEHHLHVGQAFTLPSPRPLTLRLAALTTNLGWPPGAIILNSSDYARGLGEQRPERVRDPDRRLASPVATVRERVQRALELGHRPDGRNRCRTRAAPLCPRGSGTLAADPDQAARADRRDARGGRRDGRR